MNFFSKFQITWVEKGVQKQEKLVTKKMFLFF